MTLNFPTAFILILGGLILPFFPGSLRKLCLIFIPVVAFVHLLLLPIGIHGELQFVGYTLSSVRVDKLSQIFGYVFLIAAFLNAIYALHSDDVLQQAATFVYAGSAIGAVFAGDLITLFIFWELTAISSVILIWARRTDRAYKSGMRYLITHILSGMLLLIGAIFYSKSQGSIEFTSMSLDQPGVILIFIAFGVKSAFPLLHNWLHDAYPESTEIGTVALSVFSTKLGIYALARGFAGTEILIFIGAVMATFPIFYAVIENDLRRVLTYSLNNQLGFMVVGIGIGTELAINGAVAHAFAHILYKSLLFMSMGAVLFRVGTVNGSDLGGLYKSMPWTACFCIIGAASISAFPLFSGFVAKSMIMSAALYQDHVLVWLVLLFASAGVFHHAGIKIPFFAFFAHDSGFRCKEAPPNMLIAMGIAATLCVGIGCFPDFLYQILPFAVNYKPYTWGHVLSQLQLLVFSALAFAVLMRTGIYPPELKSVNLDTDWIFRRIFRAISRKVNDSIFATYTSLCSNLKSQILSLFEKIKHHHHPTGLLARNWPTSSMVMWVAIMLASYLLIYFLQLNA